jgi:hypothetical protein
MTRRARIHAQEPGPAFITYPCDGQDCLHTFSARFSQFQRFPSRVCPGCGRRVEIDFTKLLAIFEKHRSTVEANNRRLFGIRETRAPRWDA